MPVFPGGVAGDDSNGVRCFQQLDDLSAPQVANLQAVNRDDYVAWFWVLVMGFRVFLAYLLRSPINDPVLRPVGGVDFQDLYVSHLIVQAASKASELEKAPCVVYDPDFACSLREVDLESVVL